MLVKKTGRSVSVGAMDHRLDGRVRWYCWRHESIWNFPRNLMGGIGPTYKVDRSIHSLIDSRRVATEQTTCEILDLVWRSGAFPIDLASDLYKLGVPNP